MGANRTQERRQNVSVPLPLQPIPADAFDTSLPPPQYSSDFASIVGNAASDTDGFEDIFGTLTGHLADAPNFLAGLDSIVEGVGGVGDPAGTPFEQDFADTLASAISHGQGDFDTFDVHLTGNNPPASGGSGSAGGGACGGAPIVATEGKPNGGCEGTNTTVGCVYLDNFKRVDTTGQTRGVSYTNRTQRAVTIHAFKMDGGAPIFAGFTQSGPNPVPPGSEVVFTLKINPSIAGRWHSLLTLESDDTDLSTRSMCVWLDVTASGSTGGGGGSGGGGRDI